MIVLVIKLKSPIEMKLAWRSAQKLGLVACLFVWLVEICLSNIRLSDSACFVQWFIEKEKGVGGRSMETWALWLQDRVLALAEYYASRRQETERKKSKASPSKTYHTPSIM